MVFCSGIMGYLVRWYEHLPYKSNGMVFGSGIMGYLVRWYEHLSYTWFENGIWQWDMLIGRSVNIDIMMPDTAKCKH